MWFLLVGVSCCLSTCLMLGFFMNADSLAWLLTLLLTGSWQVRKCFFGLWKFEGVGSQVKLCPPLLNIDLIASCHLDKNSCFEVYSVPYFKARNCNIKESYFSCIFLLPSNIFQISPPFSPPSPIETIFSLNLALRFWLLNDSSVLFKFQLVRYSWARSCDLIRGLMHTSPTLCYWQHMVFSGTVESSKKGGETHRAGWEISTEQKWAG